MSGEWDFEGPHRDDWGFDDDSDRSHVVWDGGESGEDMTKRLAQAQELAALDAELAFVKLQLRIKDSLTNLSNTMIEVAQKFDDLISVLEKMKDADLDENSEEFMQQIAEKFGEETGNVLTGIGPHLLEHKASGQKAMCGGPGFCRLCDSQIKDGEGTGSDDSR